MPKFDGSPYTQLDAVLRNFIQGVIKDPTETLPQNQTKFAEYQDILKHGPWAAKVKSVTASGAVGLTNDDPIFVEINPNGSNRDVNLPVKSADNHGYFVRHAGSANILVIKRSGGTEIVTLTAGKVAYVMPSAANDFVSLYNNQVKFSDDSPRVYTSSTTWNKPQGLEYVIVEVVGGGGAGGGAPITGAGEYACGGGGGGGQYRKKRIAASALGATESVSIGAGGTGVSGAGGNNGSGSVFGSHVTAAAGGGGNDSAASSTVAFINGGLGGTGGAGTADITVAGGPGMPGARSAAPHGGGGGGNPLGGGGRGQTDVTFFNGNAGGAYGGGGSGAANGASQSARAGAAGAAGVVIVWEYIKE